MIHLRSVTFQKNNQDIFPYHLPFFDKTITFDAPVTLLIGENGTGKSTLIELINEILGLYKITHHGEQNKEIQEVFKKASSFVKCSYQLKKPKGFFFSAEDFTSYIQFLVQEKNQAYQGLKRVEKEYQHKSSLSKSLASMPFNRTLGEINQLYERDLLKSSHGEAYLDFFKSRIRQNEIYLLDEPETPLSIQNQLALLSIIDDGVKQNNQFIIATHSPVIMAIPYANIYVINHENIVQVNYEDIESVKLLKQFMNHPDSFFRHLYDK